ncbi:MAG: TlyA family RNA methyltransferase [Candidatus Gracilibacteria bacterium]|nr:TlyA family RNA methyltransferase [Candidatus Gracilibacteria bacterium]
MRLDIYIANNDLAESREKAQVLIKSGKVSVNGNIIKKPAFTVEEADKIEVRDLKMYVSRSALKLEEAIKRWHVAANDTVCMDIGASTGGFSEILLEMGAGRVFAVDNGTAQLHPKLKSDKRVVSLEKTDFRTLKPATVKKLGFDHFDIIVIDVSFISLKKILEPLSEFLKTLQGENHNYEILALFKPQFEVGERYVVKGIAANIDVIKNHLDAMPKFLSEFGWQLKKKIQLTLKGKEGNQEYFLHIIPKEGAGKLRALGI